MSGLKNTIKRVVNVSIGKGYKTNAEIRAEKDAKRKSSLDRLYASAQQPDPEALRRQQRRKAATRHGSRVSTILTDDQTLG
jgi:hypothetical protein